MAKHIVKITRNTPEGNDQYLVFCTCGYQEFCLYYYEARGAVLDHKSSVKKI